MSIHLFSLASDTHTNKFALCYSIEKPINFQCFSVLHLSIQSESQPRRKSGAPCQKIQHFKTVEAPLYVEA